MNNPFPKISILVPIYNVEKYLPQCIESILAQTLKEIEIILIDDGSKDHSAELCDHYAAQDHRIKIIHKPNSGYGASMNLGLKTAQGEYIGIIESDDFVEPEMFEKLYTLAKKHDLQVVKSNFFRYTSPTGDIQQNILPTKDTNVVFNPKVKSDIFYVCPSIWSAIYQRQFLNDFKIAFLESPGASYQDTSFNFKVWAMANRVWLTPDTFVHYRCDNENASVKAKDKVFCIANEWHHIEKFMDNYPREKQASYVLRSHIKLLNYNWNLNRLTKDKKAAFKKLYLQEYKSIYQNHILNKACLPHKEWLTFLKQLTPPYVFCFYFLSYKLLRLFIKTKFQNQTKKYYLFGCIKILERPIPYPNFWTGK